jgi:RND family efflux transporter MFP subunit
MPADLSRLRLDRDPEGVSALRPRSRWRRWRGPLALALVAAAALIAGARHLGNRAVPVETATVTTAYPWQDRAVLTATGYVVAQRKAAVASKATGRLEWLGVEEGSRVRKGEVIARLENRDVSAARDQSAAQLRVAEANLQQARVEEADARTALGRAEELRRRDFVSDASVDTARARADKAAAGVRSAEASVAVARANLRAAEVNVEQTLIRAPFDGVVLTKSANIGDVVTPFSSATDAKGAVVTMADMATLEVEADVSESNLSKVFVDQPAEIQLDALPGQRYRGVVARTVPTVDRAKASVMTKIRFLEPDARILPEMSAKVTLLSEAVDEAARTPRTAVNADALARRGEGSVLFVVAEGVARAVPVTAGARIGDLVVLEGAVRPGDKVVLKPATGLADGARVTPAAR